MGNAVKEDGEFFSTLNGQYFFLKQIDHPSFGKLKMYSRKSTGKVEVYHKSIYSHQRSELSKLYEYLDRRAKHCSESLIGIFHVQLLEQDSLCGVASASLEIYFEFIQNTLAREIQKRKKEDRFFTSEEIQKIFMCIISALNDLHNENIFHGQLRLENLMIDNQLHLKLVEKTLLPQWNWRIEYAKGSINLIKGKGVLFSPVLLSSLENQETNMSSYDPMKGDVFAAGIILLMCLSLKPAEKFYNYSEFQINYEAVDRELVTNKCKYGDDILKLISSMLIDNDQDRPTAKFLLAQLIGLPKTQYLQQSTFSKSFFTRSKLGEK